MELQQFRHFPYRLQRPCYLHTGFCYPVTALTAPVKISDLWVVLTLAKLTWIQFSDQWSVGFPVPMCPMTYAPVCALAQVVSYASAIMGINEIADLLHGSSSGVVAVPQQLGFQNLWRWLWPQKMTDSDSESHSHSLTRDSGPIVFHVSLGFCGMWHVAFDSGWRERSNPEWGVTIKPKALSHGIVAFLQGDCHMRNNEFGATSSCTSSRRSNLPWRWETRASHLFAFVCGLCTAVVKPQHGLRTIRVLHVFHHWMSLN